MNFRQTVKRFFEPWWENINMFIKLTSSSIFLATYAVWNSILIWYILQNLQNNNYNEYLSFILILSIFYISFQAILYIMRHRWWWTMRHYLMEKIYRDYMKEFLQFDNIYAENIWVGKIISIIKTWVDSRSSNIIDINAKIIEIIALILSWIYFSIKIWILSSITYIWSIILIFFLVYKIDQYTIRNRNKRRDCHNSLNHHIVRMIMSKNEIILSWKNLLELDWISEYCKKAQYWNIRTNNPLFRSVNIGRIFVNIFRIIILFIFGKGIFNWTYSTSEITSILWLLVSADTILLWSAQFFKNFTSNRSNIERFRELFDNAPKIKWYDNGKTFSYKYWEIKLQNISFWYGDNSVFNNFSLELKWGTKTAFVGESGWGKTTLIKLLAGYLRPDSGEIIIDGQKLSEIKLTDYYRHIGYLTQEPSVFDGTVWENLTYALDENQEEEDQREQRIHEIIQLAKCEFIYEFEHWLQTEIGERWVRLSGWQKQRLAIAKIMLKNPNIILLDEPTSALDSFNEELVTEALHNLFKWRTVIVVAHRLQTVKNADRILYIEWWKVIEDGTHTSLIKKNGNYKKMLDLQSGF